LLQIGPDLARQRALRLVQQTVGKQRQDAMPLSGIEQLRPDGFRDGRGVSVQSADEMARQGRQNIGPTGMEPCASHAGSMVAGWREKKGKE
jgi:hypothetical protein